MDDDKRNVRPLLRQGKEITHPRLEVRGTRDLAIWHVAPYFRVETDELQALDMPLRERFKRHMIPVEVYVCRHLL